MAERRLTFLAIITRIAASIAVLAIAGGIYGLMWWTRPEPERRTEAPGPRRVVVMQAQLVQVRRQFQGYGTAEAMDTADVPSRITAIVVEIPADILPGRSVVRGQLLARLDPSDFAHQVDIATNRIADFDAQLARLDIETQSWTERVQIATREVNLLKAEFERVQAARRRDAAKIREVEIAELAWTRSQRNLVSAKEELAKIPTSRRRVEAQKSGQQASLRLAQLNLDRCEITSPIDGVLQAVDVEIGENIATGQRVARVVSLERVEVPIQVAASSRPFLTIGDEVLLESAGNSRQTWQAAVSRIAPEDDESSRSMTVYVELVQNPTDPSVLAPGKFVRAQLNSARSEPRWIVPRRAMRNDRILTVSDGAIMSRRIDVAFQIQQEYPQFGLPDDLWLVLGEGSILQPGTLVTVTPSRSLTDGLTVEAILYDGQPPVALGAKEPAR